MNAQIVWQDATSTEFEGTTMGLAFEVFKGFKVFQPATKADKKAVIMFRDEVNNKTATVVMTTDVSNKYKAKTISLPQLLSLPVIHQKALYNVERDANGVETKRTLITDQPTMWLGRPANWIDMDTLVVDTNFNYEDLA
jgi:hypothetical protein